MRPLRILHVSPYCEQAWAYGGIPRVVGALARGLAARGHGVTVCTTDAGLDAAPGHRTAQFNPAETSAGGAGRVDVRVFPNVSERLAYDFQLFVPVGMRRFLRDHADRFDVAHLHAYRNIPGLLAARYLTRAGVPYVVAPHGTSPNIERQFVAKAAFDRVVGRRFLRRAAKLIAVTEAERLQFAEQGVPNDKISVIPNPIALEEFVAPVARGAFRRHAGIGDAPLVLFLGKLTPRKRVDTLARAFARLDRPDARLVIAGNDMGAGALLHRLVDDLGVRPLTTFAGLLSGVARLEALADADVVVYASEHEIFGLVPVEALLCGVPVIVGDDSGCAEVITALGGGLLVRPGDVEALTGALRAVLDEPGRWRAAALDASARVPAFCGAAVVCERLERLYRAVLDADAPQIRATLRNGD